MEKNRLQVVLPDDLVEKFDREAKKQGRSRSNLIRKYIVDGLTKDLEKEVKK